MTGTQEQDRAGAVEVETVSFANPETKPTAAGVLRFRRCIRIIRWFPTPAGTSPHIFPPLTEDKDFSREAARRFSTRASAPLWMALGATHPLDISRSGRDGAVRPSTSVEEGSQ